jgi:hypothetical protein
VARAVLRAFSGVASPLAGITSAAVEPRGGDAALAGGDHGDHAGLGRGAGGALEAAVRADALGGGILGGVGVEPLRDVGAEHSRGRGHRHRRDQQEHTAAIHEPGECIEHCDR